MNIHPVAAGQRALFWLIVPLSVLGITLLSRLVVEMAYADRVYPGVHLSDLSLGGQTVEQAASSLAPTLHAYERRTLAVQAGEWVFNLTSGDLGFRPQPMALATAAYEVGRRGNLLMRLAGPVLTLSRTPPISLSPAIDDAALAEAVGKMADAVDHAPENAQLRLSPQVEIKPGHRGRLLDQTAARVAIRTHHAELRTAPIDLPVQQPDPPVTAMQLDPLRARATAILDRTITIGDDRQRWSVPTDQLRAALAVQSEPPTLDLEPAVFSDLVDDVAGQINRAARDARLTIVQGKAQVEDATEGRTVDRSATLASLRQQVLAGESAVPLVVRTVEPATKASDLEELVVEVQALIDRGLVLTADDQQYRLSTAELGDLLAVAAPKSEQALIELDAAKVRAVVTRLSRSFERPALQARFTWSPGQVKPVQPVIPSRTIDEPAAVQSIVREWRNGQVVLPVVDAPLTNAADYLAHLNQALAGVIAESQTPYRGSIPQRAQNIELAARRLNGVLVAPGGTFSFNEALGPTTVETGFQWGIGIANDGTGQSRAVPAVAGGICQVATTVFQPVFWAGYQIEERNWHNYWIESYRSRGYPGLDATVDEDSGLDFKFKNTTDFPLLVQAWTTDQVFHVALVGTNPDWTVEVDPPVVTDVVKALSAVERTTSPLFPKGQSFVTSAAQDGFKVTIVRRVTAPDGSVRRLALSSTYAPVATAILVGTGE